jgi:hypothetical protein
MMELKKILKDAFEKGKNDLSYQEFNDWLEEICEQT